jgi:hypothetical protein
VFGCRVSFRCMVESFGRVLVGRFAVSLFIVFRGPAMAPGGCLVKLRRGNVFLFWHDLAPCT